MAESSDHRAAVDKRRRLALALLLIAPALFASNMLVARATHELIPPVALAFWRWGLTFLLMLPLTAGALLRHRVALAREWPDLLVLGALGMGVCGAFVYIGADTTSATNIGLIYAASPVLIMLLAGTLYGERLGGRQLAGVALSLLGVVTIIARGRLDTLLGLAFTAGDLWIVAAMIGWALYSVLLRHRPSGLPMLARFVAIAGGGLLALLPFHLWELAAGQVPRLDATSLGAVAFLALCPSLGAYLSYAFIQEVLGAGRASLMIYLIPLYNGILAMALLDERLEPFHLVGAALVLPGIWLSTRRAG